METNTNNVVEQSLSPTPISSWSSNLIASFILTSTSLIFVFIANFLYVAIFTIFIIKGSVDMDSGPTVLSDFLSIIIPAIMVWLGVFSSRSYLQKRHEQFNVSKIISFSTLIFVLIMLGSTYSNYINEIGSGAFIVALFKIVIVSIIFYFSSKHYLTPPSSTLQGTASISIVKPKPFSGWGFKLGVISLFLLMTYFFMFFGMILSPMGAILSVVNFVAGIKQHDTKARNLAILGFIINICIAISAIAFFLHPKP